jgi:hypothetical protein
MLFCLHLVLIMRKRRMFVCCVSVCFFYFFLPYCDMLLLPNDVSARGGSPRTIVELIDSWKKRWIELSLPAPSENKDRRQQYKDSGTGRRQACIDWSTANHDLPLSLRIHIYSVVSNIFTRLESSIVIWYVNLERLPTALNFSKNLENFFWSRWRWAAPVHCLKERDLISVIESSDWLENNFFPILETKQHSGQRELRSQGTNKNWHRAKKTKAQSTFLYCFSSQTNWLMLNELAFWPSLDLRFRFGSYSGSSDDWICLDPLLPCTRDHVDVAEIRCCRYEHLSKDTIMDGISSTPLLFLWTTYLTSSFFFFLST